MALAPGLSAGCGHQRRPSAGREPREKKEEDLAEKKPPLALVAAPTYSIDLTFRRKGEGEEEEKEREGPTWEVSYFFL